MKIITKTLVAISICLIASAPTYAGHGKSRLLDRFERQHERIQNGIASGQLTRGEAKKLKKQQRGIRRLTREFREDGRLNKNERRILTAKLDKASNRIWKFKHNNHYRHSTRHRYSSSNKYSDHNYRWPHYGMIGW